MEAQELTENPFQIHGALLARNTVLNLTGNVVPLLVGLATIPYVVRGLGTDSFGILSIAWVLLGYFSLFDLGLGRATTKFVAEYLGHGKIDQLPGLVWTSLGIQVLFGVAGTLLVGALTPFLVDRVLKVPASLVGETKVSFLILAASLPVVLATNGLRGVLEAAQRFDLVNYVKVPANVSIFLLPAIALPFGLRLPGIVFLLVLARFAATLGYVAISLRIFPVLRKRVEFRPALLRQLLTYGGWVTVSNVVNPLLVYMDRFFIAAMMMASALAFYSVPFEVVTRLWIVASGLATTLFPAFSTLDSSGQRNRLESLYSRSLKYMLVVVTPVVLVLIVFARDILNIWLGADFAARSTLPMQILAVGVLTNSLTYLPYSLLQALNRPAAVAKLFAIELPCYAALLPFMISHFGIVGGAVAWCVRVTVEAFVFLVVAQKLLSLSPRVWTDRGLRASMGAVVLLSAALLPISVFLGGALVLRGGICSACLAVFVWVVWRHILNDVDRGLVRTMVGPAVGTARR